MLEGSGVSLSSIHDSAGLMMHMHVSSLINWFMGIGFFRERLFLSFYQASVAARTIITFTTARVSRKVKNFLKPISHETFPVNPFALFYTY